MRAPLGVSVGFVSALLAAPLGCGEDARPVPAHDPEPEAAEVCRGICVTRIAGNGEFGYRDGLASEAQFELPRDIDQGPSGELYVADTFASAIRVIEKGEVRTLVGGKRGGFRDGPLAEAQLNGPAGLAVDDRGNVFVADASNHRIRMIAGGMVTTIAGNGEAGHRDGPVEQALFNLPVDVAVDDRGNLYVTELDNYDVRKISTDGWVSTVAGDPLSYDIERPRFIAIGPSGAIYFTDGERHLIRRIVSGRLETVSGCVFPGYADGDAQIARFDQPTGIAVDDRERIFVSDTGNRRIRMIDRGVVSVVAGTGYIGDEDGQGASSTFHQPLGLTVGSDGALYVTEAQHGTVRRIQLP